MSEKRNSREVEIDRLAKKLAKLVEIFRRGGKANDFKWWNSNSPRSIFYPLYGYQDGQPLFEEVVQGVLKLNPEMLSEYEVERKLVYDFLQTQAISWTEAEHLSNQSLVSEAKNHLNKLIEFEAWQDVDIPIANLWLGGGLVKLGKVTFMEVAKEELEQWEKRALWSGRAPDFRVVARVRAPGDLQKALSYAETTVNQVLDVLRAFCFPFGRYSDTWRIGILGDTISSTSTPMRIDNRNFPTRIGASLAQIELSKHILSKLEQPQLELINKLILKAESSRSKMERKLFDGIHWLAEAAKPDTNRAKFAKISIALEALIGGEPRDEYLQVRGITAMLAERAAFIVGTNKDDRLAVDKDIRIHYSKRSSVMHGTAGDVPLNEIDEFGELVRRIAIALLEKLDKLGDKISSVDKLEKWARSQRYTLAE